MELQRREPIGPLPLLPLSLWALPVLQYTRKALERQRPCLLMVLLLKPAEAIIEAIPALKLWLRYLFSSYLMLVPRRLN